MVGVVNDVISPASASVLFIELLYNSTDRLLPLKACSMAGKLTAVIGSLRERDKAQTMPFVEPLAETLGLPPE